MRRVAAGEEKVIIAEKPLILAMTSGTSGPSAMLLSTNDTNTDFFLQVSPMGLLIFAPITISVAPYYYMQGMFYYCL